jgi:hypothetical protein
VIEPNVFLNAGASMTSWIAAGSASTFRRNASIQGLSGCQIPPPT